MRLAHSAFGLLTLASCSPDDHEQSRDSEPAGPPEDCSGANCMPELDTGSADLGSSGRLPDTRMSAPDAGGQPADGQVVAPDAARICTCPVDAIDLSELGGTLAVGEPTVLRPATWYLATDHCFFSLPENSCDRQQEFLFRIDYDENDVEVHSSEHALPFLQLDTPDNPRTPSVYFFGGGTGPVTISVTVLDPATEPATVVRAAERVFRFSDR